MPESELEKSIPGLFNPDEHYLQGGFVRSAYEARPDKFIVNDAVWGECEIGGEPGDEVLLELLDNDLIRRLMSIAQLTLGARYESMPNVADMSRWEHAWGSVVLVRAITKEMNMDPLDSLGLQLRTFLSDVGHTAFSHLGDWMFQGFGGPENLHDTELIDLLEVGGVNDVLRGFGVNPDEVISENANDWVESPLPDLCVDRVDYGARQMKRCFPETHNSTNLQAFTVDEAQRLIMTSESKALAFAKGFALLPTEHWGEPVRRLQLLLTQEMVKRIFVTDEPLISNWMDCPAEYNPRDYMYTVDWDMLQSMQVVDPFMWVVSEITEDVARSQRRYFTQVRGEELARFFWRGSPDFPVPGKGETWRSKYHPGHPSNVQIIPIQDTSEIEDFGDNPLTIDFELVPLKPRAVDPLFLDKRGGIRRLSDANESFAKILRQQAKVSNQRYVARLLLTPEYREIINSGLEENRNMWPELLQRPRMPQDRFKRLVSKAGRMTSINLIDLRWYR